MNPMNNQDQLVTAQPEKRNIQCGKVFFAQTHVLEPTEPLFRLVGNVPALIKVQVNSEEQQDSPALRAAEA